MGFLETRLGSASSSSHLNAGACAVETCLSMGGRQVRYLPSIGHYYET